MVISSKTDVGSRGRDDDYIGETHPILWKVTFDEKKINKNLILFFEVRIGQFEIGISELAYFGYPYRKNGNYFARTPPGAV